MYKILCDGFPILDFHDKDCIVANPRVKFGINTVGEGSFTIYKNHPNYDKIKILKSIIEVIDDNETIFRGRATGDTINFEHGKAVDIEGAAAYFNDSIVRPFSFPEDFTENEEYISSAEYGNVVRFFLKWLIENHNSQVQDFQKIKLGRVNVSDPNNYITRSSKEHATTWDIISGKLFGSSLGGYLCVRYEEDGNYIDYLTEFEELNAQTIRFGNNILDFTTETEGSASYSAMIPIGADGLTLVNYPDRDVYDDLVKTGDTIYSRSAVEELGWIYAPPAESKWEDVTRVANLFENAVNKMQLNCGKIAKVVEATAVDLHFTDEQIKSFRIYQNVYVYLPQHNVAEVYPLEYLEIDLLNPQNTKITVGKSTKTFTDKTTGSIDGVAQESDKTASNYFDSLQVKVVESVESDLNPGEYRVFGEVDGLSINLVEVNNGTVNEYMFEFIPSDTFTGLDITPEVRWANDPKVLTGVTHQVSILRGIGVMISA